MAADTAQLVASLTLKDQFSKGLQSAEKSLGHFETRLGKIGTIAQRGVASAANNLKTIGLVAGGLLATQVYAGIKSLDELERVTNATKGVIESTGGAAGVTAGQVRDMSQALESLTTVDDKVIEGGAGILLTFTNINEDIFPQTLKLTNDLAIAMAQGDVAAVDLKATAIQLGKALNDPTKGLTALTRVGVSFTKEQKDQIKALQESGDLLGAQKIILAELEREFGKAGEAAGKGFGADMRRFQDAVEDAQQALARGFLPVIRKVADWLSRKLAEPGTLKAIEDFGNELAGAFDDILETAKNIPWGSIADAMKLAGQGAKAALDFFTKLPPWVQTAVLTGWGLNKLTGGALGGIVGELGKGLVKGVLGMNAGVVNINAGIVNGAGGIPGGGAAAGAGRLATVASFVIPAAGLTALAAGIVVGFKSLVLDPGLDKQSSDLVDLTKKTITENRGNTALLQNALAAVDTGIGKLIGKGDDPIARALFGKQVADLEESKRLLQAALDQSKTGWTKQSSKQDQMIAISQATKDANQKQRAALVALATSERADSNRQIAKSEAIKATLSRVGEKMDGVKTAAQNTAEAIRGKKWDVRVNVPVTVQANVSYRGVTTSARIFNLYQKNQPV